MRKPREEMSEQEIFLDRARDVVNMTNCFWGADANIYGVEFANHNVCKAEAWQREVAGKIIAGDFDHPIVDLTE